MRLVDAVWGVHEWLRGIGVPGEDMAALATTRAIEQMKEESKPQIPEQFEIIDPPSLLGMPLIDIGDADGHIAAWVGVRVVP